MARPLGVNRDRPAAAAWAVRGANPGESNPAHHPGRPRVSTNGMQHNNGRHLLTRSSSAGGSQLSELIEHLALAVMRHVCHLRQDALQVPPSVDELAATLVRCVQTRPMATPAEHEWTVGGRAAHDEPVTRRLLVTKAEAAELLGVSVRTIERLIAHGQLPLLHIERASRLRLADIEAYVNSLVGEQATAAENGQKP
jgi:excisionase family DNA binding protein